MFYIVLKEKDTEKLFNCWGLDTRILNSALIKNDYKLALVSGKIELIAKFLRTENIPARMLVPYINTKLFEEIFGEATAHKYNLKPVFRSEQTILQSILAAEKNIKSSSNLYYYIGAKDSESAAKSTKIIEMINAQLAGKNLLIDDTDIISDEHELFMQAVDKTIKERLGAESRNIALLQKQDPDFFLNCIAEFILLAADKNYSKEQIEQYLRREILNELDSRSKK